MADLKYDFGDVGTYTNDGSALTLGVVFTVDANVDCVGVTFYKDASETTSTGRTYGLWSEASGTLLASGTGGSEASSGQIDLYFGTPYGLTSGTEYVVGKFSSEGRYRACDKLDPGGYDQVTGNAPYTVASNGVTLTLPDGEAATGRNARYAYDAALIKPVSTFSDEGYTVSPIIDDGASTDVTPATVAATVAFPALTVGVNVGVTPGTITAVAAFPTLVAVAVLPSTLQHVVVQPGGGSAVVNYSATLLAPGG